MMHILLIVLSIAIIATIGTIFYHFVDTQYKTETAVSATAEQSETFQGVYVRDETVLTYNGSGAISYNVPDGGKVEKGGTIAEIYAAQSALKCDRRSTESRDQRMTLARRYPEIPRSDRPDHDRRHRRAQRDQGILIVSAKIYHVLYGHRHARIDERHDHYSEEIADRRHNDRVIHIDASG